MVQITPRTHGHPVVTIVITAYQKARYIARAMESVLDQTFKNFEVIVVDDGSTDDTESIVKSYAEKDQRVRYIYQQNQGPGSARNTGIRHAQSDLIALLDGDDAWLPDKLDLQMKVITTYPEIALLFTNSRYISSIDQSSTTHADNYYHDYVITHFELLPLDQFDSVYLFVDIDCPEKFALKNVFNLSTVLLRRSAWEAVGGFNELLRGPEDLDFWTRAALKNCRFAYSSHIGAVYYKNETSLVQLNERTALEQLKHALYAYQSPEYEPIRDTTRQLVQKRYRQLIALYSNQYQRHEAWRAFRQSRQYGMSVRSLLLATASIIGPYPMRLYGSLRRWKL